MINQFHLTESNLPYLVEKLRTLDFNKHWVVTAKERQSRRSGQQNDRYWAFLTEFGAYLGYTPDEAHEICKYKFLRNAVDVNGEQIPLMRSTTKLTTKEFTDYMDSLELWAAQLGFVWMEAA